MATIEEEVATKEKDGKAIEKEEQLEKSNMEVKEEQKVPCAMDEVWVEGMVLTLDALEVKYTPHPLPYEDPPGVLHSADVHPPQVDFYQCERGQFCLDKSFCCLNTRQAINQSEFRGLPWHLASQHRPSLFPCL